MPSASPSTSVCLSALSLSLPTTFIPEEELGRWAEAPGAVVWVTSRWDDGLAVKFVFDYWVKFRP